MNVNKYQIRSIILALIATCILATASYFIYDTLTFRITAQDPRDNSIFSSAAVVSISFNKQLKPLDDQKISISPAIAGKWIIRQNTITFHPYALFDDREYTINLSEVEAVNGMKLQYKFSFDIDTELGLTEEQIEKSIATTDNIENEYSVLSKNVVPYRASDYVIEYTLPEDEEQKMTLTVSFTPPEYMYNSPSEYEIFVETNTKAAKDYLITKGIDLSDYRIVFVR